MISDSSRLKKNQILKVDVDHLNDRFSEKIKQNLLKNPYGKLVGYKMVDGNQFGLVLKLEIGMTRWFFEDELTEGNTISQ